MKEKEKRNILVETGLTVIRIFIAVGFLGLIGGYVHNAWKSDELIAE